jgi:DNA-binding NtrC family response regulator
MTSGETAPQVSPLVLVVDDDANQRRLLGRCLEQEGYRVLTATDGADALEELGREPVGLMVSDVRMPGLSGLELMHQARQDHPALPVLMVTGYADIRDAVGAMRDGALSYLEKPIDLDEFLDLVRSAVGPGAGKRTRAEQSPADLPIPESVVAESPAMRDALREARLIAPFDSRVLITGESGTGKEVVADLIHAWSPRAGKPIVRVNCAAIPEQLLESELFGHEKGAFTGASAPRAGRFEQANGGTLFLDEIGEMPPSIQAKLLRVTQDGTFQRLGADRETQTDVRIIAATNRDLEQDVAEGRFREDLFYRLNVIEIHLPPLRDRPADILPLAVLFAREFADEHYRISPAVAAAFAVYAWPGNVRELRNAIERAVLMGRGGVILPEHLPRRINEAVGEKPAPTREPGEAQGRRLQDIEDLVILQTLRQHGYNRTETARALGISRRALLYKLRRLEEEGHATHPQ